MRRDSVTVRLSVHAQLRITMRGWAAAAAVLREVGASGIAAVALHRTHCPNAAVGEDTRVFVANDCENVLGGESGSLPRVPCTEGPEKARLSLDAGTIAMPVRQGSSVGRERAGKFFLAQERDGLTAKCCRPHARRVPAMRKSCSVARAASLSSEADHPAPARVAIR